MLARCFVLLAFFLGLTTIPASAAPAYTNPLPLRLDDGGHAFNCADPYVLEADRWYLYCTSDILEPGGPYVLLPTYSSTDMVHWSYAGAAVPARPAWVGNGGLWAPDVVAHGHGYLLYYTASDTAGAGGSAIGVLTGPTPLGPWTDAGAPVVAPADSPYQPGTRRWTYDPQVLTAEGRTYLYYGSYVGGISVRELSADGLTSSAATEKQITIDNRYEASFVLRHHGWYYLMVSATNCCTGPLTGYAVFAGRSRSPLGPFTDRDGVPLLATRPGGTPVLTQNGNRWVGPGHDAVVTDHSGQQWIYYHAIDRDAPYLPDHPGYTRRQLLLDPLDWIGGWPVATPTEQPMPVPAARPGSHTAYHPRFPHPLRPGPPLRALSDDFAGPTLSPRWQWIRPPAPGTYRLGDGALTIDTQPGDLQPPAPDPASVLTEPAPRQDFLVETRVSVDLPDDGSSRNFVQGGLVVYNDDGNYVKLVVSPLWDIRQSEFGVHVAPGSPAYGNTVVGPVGASTYLRIARHRDRYTAYTSLDGEHWDAGGTWTLPTTAATRIGLVSMGGAGYQSTFAYVHVNALPTT